MMESIRKNKKFFIFGMLVLLILVFVVGASGHFAFAQEDGVDVESVGDAEKNQSKILQGIATGLNAIALVLVDFFGKILSMLISIFVGIVGFSEFVDSRAVVLGWVLVRDLANIFFVVLMLLIAVGTIFKIQVYEYKKLLPKLFMAAILVNFSKTIVGVFIDIGQVAMLTFVKAFQDISAGAIVNGLGVKQMTEMKNIVDELNFDGGEIDMFSLAGASFLAVIMLIVAIVTFLTLIIVLLGRIIMLWILLILSPIAFLVSAFGEGGPGKSLGGAIGNFWGELTKYIIVGPILAMFLWLSFAIISQIDTENQKHTITLYRMADNYDGGELAQDDAAYAAYLASKISSPQAMFDYMTTIALLIGALMITQQLGVMGGSFGSNAINKMKSFGQKALKAVAIGGTLGAGAWAASHIKAGTWLPAGLGKFTKGVDLNLANVARNLKRGFEEKKMKREYEGTKYAEENLSHGGFRGLLTGASAHGYVDTYMSGFMGLKGIKQVMAPSIRNAQNVMTEGQGDYVDGLKKDMDDYKDTYKGNLAKDIKKNERSKVASRISGKLTNAEIQQSAEKLWRKDGNTGPMTGMAAIGYRQRATDNLINSRLKEESETMAEERLDSTIWNDSAYKDKKKKYEKANAEYEKNENLKEKWRNVRPDTHSLMDMQRMDIDERKRKYRTGNEGDLIRHLDTAISRGDATEAMAVVASATDVSHLNEMLWSQRASKDYYDKEGNITTRKGERFASDVNGLNDFVNQVFINKLGAGEQAAYAFQTDLSDVAQSKGWYKFAQSTEVDAKTGKTRQRTKKEASLASMVESDKEDLERAHRNYGRGYTMVEFEDDEGDRVSVLDEAGINRYLKDYASQNNRFRMNKSTTSHLMTKLNWDIMLDIAEQSTGIERVGLKADGSIKEDDEDFTAWMHKVADFTSAEWGKEVGKLRKEFNSGALSKQDFIREMRKFKDKLPKTITDDYVGDSGDMSMARNIVNNRLRSSGINKNV